MTPGTQAIQIETVHKSIVPVACLVLGLTGGVLIRGSLEHGKLPVQSRPSKESSTRDRRAPAPRDRLVPGDAKISDLMDLLKTGRYGVANARLTLALDEVDPGQLADLASELRENYRKNPSYDWRQAELLGSVMSSWADADPDAALAFAAESPSKLFRSRVYSEIFNVLAEADPEGAVARARTLESGMERKNAMTAAAWATARKDPQEAIRLFSDVKEVPDYVRMSLIEELARNSPEEAVLALGKISPTKRRRFWNSESVFATWAASDPEAVMAWAAKTEDLDMRNSALKAACSRSAADDPAAAMGMIDTMPAHLRSELIASVMTTWADRDISAAIAAATAMDKPAERESAMMAIVNNLDWMDPSAASKVVLAMPKGNARNSALDQLAWGLAWQPPADRMALLAQFEGVEYSKMAGRIAGEMVSEDAEAAMKLFSSVPPTQRSDDDFTNFMWSLSRHDPDVALEFASSLSSATERSQAVRQAISQLANLSPAKAAERLDSLNDPKDRQQALVALAETWGANDPDAALRWAESLSGDEQTSALASLLPERAKNDPAAAGDRLRSLLENPGNTSGSVLQTATGNLAREWAGRAPDEAAAWVAGLPAGAAADAGASSLVQNWSNHDPVSAADWIATLPDGGTKDAAIQPLVEAIRQNDPESAFAWGLSVQDAAKRSAVMEATIRNWNTNDPEAAKAAVANATLNPKERAAFEKLLR